ncbi:cytochrome ubiquinol oxidase subunit I, partial [Intestinimonas massiliensis]
VTAMTGDKSGAVIARVQPMKLAAMEALYDGQQGAPLTAIGIVRPEAERTSNEDAFYFKLDIPKLLSIMSFRDADAYVAGINDLVNGNEKYGVMSAAEKMERG